jgi:hypothetical protein
LSDSDEEAEKRKDFLSMIGEQNGNETDSENIFDVISTTDESDFDDCLNELDQK